MYTPLRRSGGRRRRARLTALPVALLLAVPALAGATTPDTPDDAVATPAAPVPVAGEVLAPGSYPVTLVTGDRVVLSATPDGWQVRPAGEPRPGVRLQQSEVDGQRYAVPSDAAALVPRVLDRELFNVTKLAALGYTEGVPVIVSGSPAVGPAPMPTAGLAATTTLSSIDGLAGTVAPGSTWWTAVRAAATRAPLGKVWLDEPARVTLEESAPLVGAPEAWAAGFDGTGVTVAVLDSGIDVDHPDLAGTVVAAENFTDDPGPGDVLAHGTHVAGIVAGTGAASEGRYAGMAPGVELLSGKVCDTSGFCQQAAMIAGMEWAAARADVINMSIGTRTGSDGTDPLSQTVNNLTEEHGVLFVISAGNNGQFGAGTVGSPGAADAALTVGSVDKTAELALTSSRGPRLGDFAIKPDITAPGEAIVSAFAGGLEPPPGTEPVGENYLRASGTSMAAPHVTGAAAILLQQDPDLDPVTLKAALTTTATPHPDLTPYQQGGGLLDIPGALDAGLRTSPATLDFGHFSWPHDGRETVRATVTYTNRSEGTVRVRLTPQVTGPDGAAAADGALTVTPSRFNLRAGASVEVEVALDTRVAGDGLFGGYLVAAGRDGVLARTPTGYAKDFPTIDSGAWRQRQKLASSALEAEAAFGRAIAVDGDTMIVGASGNAAGEVSRGAAYVFTRVDGEWVEQDRLVASDGAAFASFGVSVALDGDTAVVGALTATVDGDVNRGAAYVFTRSGETWTEQAKLVASDGGPAHNYGGAVAVAGDTVLVGAQSAQPEGMPRQGAVYAYTRSWETWTEQQQILAPDATGGEGFGRALALDGDTAVAGAPFQTIDGNFLQGAVYVLDRGAGGWGVTTRLLASDGGGFQGFGVSVALDGGTALVGTPAAEVGGSTPGAAYVFTRAGDTGAGDEWTEQAKLTADETGDDGSEVGSAVALEGDVALVGGPWTAVDGNAVQGAAWIFTRTGGDWHRDARLTAADGSSDDFLGGAVALADGTAYTGAWLAEVDEDEDCPPGNPSCGEQGTVYTFQADLELAGAAHRSRGQWFTELSWTGSAGAVDVYRDGEHVATVTDARTHTDPLGRVRPRESFVYQVCREGTDECSEEVTVVLDPRGGLDRPR